MTAINGARAGRPRHLLALAGLALALGAGLAGPGGRAQSVAAAAESRAPNHLVPGARLSPRLGAGGAPHSDYPKYVNYTRAGQISAPALHNIPEVSATSAARLASGSRASRRSVGQQQQQQLIGASAGLVSPPKLVQWSKEAVQYYEGSTLVLSCSLSYAGGEPAQLKFSWFKQGKPLAAGRPPDPAARLSIETLADYSFLRLAELRPGDSGAYTCVVSNSLGQDDRTTTQVIVNVKLKWLMPLAPEANHTSLVGPGHPLVKVRAGQPVSFECNAAGGAGQSKALRVRWFRLATGPAAPAAATAGHTGADLYHRQPQAAPVSRSSHRPLDEAQIRASLAQVNTVQASGESFGRVELVNSNGEMDYQRDAHAQPHNDSRLRWRIETSSGSSSSAAFQQQEIYSRLVLDRPDPSAGGLYECEVSSALATHDLQSEASQGAGGRAQAKPAATLGDNLRKFFGLFVNGK